ncbi:MAG: ubiquinone/menaquinone biosynthesis C-methylase UbiE [Pirellulaceae bacterium]|jgi:ubiquinone/menaquinone biosynthesis C-methylase UbiE
MVRQKKRFTHPVNDEDFADPLKNVDGLGWLGGNIEGKNLLCLAAGGGRQSALYAKAGAKVTVVDISPEMLQIDREVAKQRQLDVTTVEASMDFMPMFNAGQFDVVIHPVSSCYIPQIGKMYSEVARVTAPGGLYISQHKSPTSLQADIVRSHGGYELLEPYYRTGPLPAVVGSRHREEGTLEFLHRWEQLLGEMCRAGFVIEDLVEPRHAEVDAKLNSFADRSQFVAPYVRIKARRKNVKSTGDKVDGSIWLP